MKNILITGASSGIGRAIADCLKHEHNLFLTGRRPKNEKNYLSFDLTKDDIDILINKAKSFFNDEIDVLINCAGQYIYKPIEKMTPCEINYLTELNFKIPYILSCKLIVGMKEKKWGRIINIGSISGMVGEGNATLYSATKAGLSGLTRALALESAQYNITVNQINPGWVETPLTNEYLNKEDKKEIIDITPQKRFIEPIEIATLCKYLISNEAKGLTGQNINLCAGLSIGS